MMWYYAAEGRQAGPISQTELAALVQQGQVTMESLVWREGMANWQPLRDVRSSIPELAAAVVASAGAAAQTGVSQAGAPPSGEICSECGNLFPQDQVIRYG